jgi:hypothetical protein
MMEAYAEALKLWGQMRGTKYPDAEIQNIISSGKQYSGCDYANEAYAQSCFLQAQAMIAYNEMIDKRIESARKSWKREVA